MNKAIEDCIFINNQTFMLLFIFKIFIVKLKNIYYFKIYFLILQNKKKSINN